LATESLEIDYKVARFLVSVDSGIIVDDGEDWEPGAGFSPTTEWQPGAPVRDNRAFRLPSDLPPGSYRLWVVLYAQDSDGTPQRLPVTEGAVTDDNVGILPMIIEVQP
jgi:hypothetical protein